MLYPLENMFQIMDFDRLVPKRTCGVGI